MSTSASEDTVEVRANIPASTYDRWKGLYPFHGAVTWTITTIMEEMVALAEKEPTAREKIRDAIRSTYRRI